MNPNNRSHDEPQTSRRRYISSRRSPWHAQATRAGGFAGALLAELLIATGVTAGLVVMLGWMLGSLMRTGSHATARVDAFRDARAAMQMIERDLRNLVRNQWDRTKHRPIRSRGDCLRLTLHLTKSGNGSVYCE